MVLDAVNAELEGVPEAQVEVIRVQALQKYISPHAFGGRNAEKGTWDGRPPAGFSLSMNLGLSLGMIGQAFGSLIFSRLCDKIGCKIPIQICTLAGIGGYFIMYAGGIWVKSYWLFVIGYVWNNFFGCTMPCATVYFNQVWTVAPTPLVLLSLAH